MLIIHAIAIFILQFLLWDVAAWAKSKKPSPDYHEALTLQPLPQSALLASFNFRSNESLSAFEKQNFQLFPRSLAQILQHTHARELHIRFSSGRWDSENWGERPWGGSREGGTGVELWAWMEADNREEATARWLALMNALSGLFCASLNFIDATRTLCPEMSFEPEGDYPSAQNPKLHLLYGSLPHEVVCTENLTPFLKQLPCKGKAGISSLLDGHKLFDASWQAMAIDVRPRCQGYKEKCFVQIEQTVDMVLDIERSKRPRDNPIPRPVPVENLRCDTSKFYHSADTCYPLDYLTEPQWSISEVFGHPIKGSCPLTAINGEEAETVWVNIPKSRKVTVEAISNYISRQTKDGLARSFKIGKDDFDLIFPEAPRGSINKPVQTRLHAARSFTGYGQERGGMQTVLRNPSRTSAVDIVYLESLPWFMRPYIHTLEVTIKHANGTTLSHPVKEMFYRSAIDRRRGTHLELLLSAPPASTLFLTYSFSKALLRYTEYPPDANRGFDVASAVIRVRSSDAQSGPTYLRTTNLLLPLPTPDFSMPYNVIILTSTVIALGFGNIFNLLVRRFVGADEVVPFNISGLKTKLLLSIQRAFTETKDKGGKAQ